MEEFCIVISFLVLVDFASLVPYGFFTVNEIVYLSSYLVYLWSKGAPIVLCCKGVESFPFLCDFLRNVAYHILVPGYQVTRISLEVCCNPLWGGGEATRVPGWFNDFTTISSFDPHGFEVKASFSVVDWARGVWDFEDTMVRCWFDHMLHSSFFEGSKPARGGKSSIKSKGNSVCAFLHVAPSKVRTTVTKVLETT